MSDTQAYIVEGMTCGGCAASVTRAIQAAAPAAAVAVDLPSKTVTVSGADEAAVARAVDDAGFEFKGKAGS